ncbi:MAG: relaxase/mobilization nuclease domain-containing protein [Clostridia bacterium]|nr:relaxase/mobilization nuclease domain-containing protein [Clostridia bacterium]
MATTRLIPLHAGKGRTEGTAIRDILDYSKNPDKTEKGELITSYACDHRTADAEFLLAKREYLERTGRYRGKDDVIAYHMRQSFLPGEITPEEANRMGQELARRFTHGNHAYIVATHTDKQHIHNHIIFHSVNLDFDRKFRNFFNSTRALHKLSDTICIENGYSIVADPKRHGQAYNKWLGDRAKLPQREAIRILIDDALAQKPADLDALLELLKATGCEIKRGKKISIRGPGQTRFKRLDTLGEDYDLPALIAILAGERTHQPRKRTHTADVQMPKVNLLVDIQAQLRAGKGPGYERWAKRFNIKQMAQTLNYLTENGLLNYHDLKKKAQQAEARCNALASAVKATEAKLAENAVLQTHILNYIKTREVYAAYRQSGYSKKFLAEHEGEITLHKAAKKAFDALELKKLPTIKTLRTEYAALLAEKKQNYAEYRQVRDEMRQLLKAKANVELLLGIDEKEAAHDKEVPVEQR